MSDQIKERTIEKSREKFFSNGFSKVTMDELAIDLGISKKTLYKFSPSKDELLEAVVQRQITWVSGQVNQIINADVEYIEKLHRSSISAGHSTAQAGTLETHRSTAP